MRPAMLDKIHTWLWDSRFMACLMVVNILGSVYGYYWYRNQLAATDLLFWPVVPDSPLSTTLFALVLFFSLMKKKVVILPLLAVAFLIKYGLWAVVINLHLLFLGEGFTWINLMLAMSHFGMAVEAVLYYPGQNTSLQEALPVAAILIFEDFMDYVVGLHPYLFSEAQYPVALFTALLLTGIIIGFMGYRFLNQD